MRVANREEACRAFRPALLLSLVLVATAVAMAERLPIKTYTAADGLPRDHIKRIVPDSRGLLWFCTTEGLARFDGYGFVNYGADQGLPSRYVYDFLESRSGIYWVATGRGLCRFNPDFSLPTKAATPDAAQRFIVYFPGDKEDTRIINVIHEDHAGTLWCGTDAGLYRLDQINGQWVFTFVDIITPSGTENSRRVRAILEDRKGSLWISAEAGLYRQRPDGVVELYTHKHGLPIQNTLLEDRGGWLWAGTQGGLYQLVSDPQPDRPVVAQVYTAKDGLAHNAVIALCQSSSGKLWAGTGLGLSELLPAPSREGRRFQSYTVENGLSDPIINALAEDHDGNLWMGAPYGGAMRLAVNGFLSYKETDGLGGVGIASIFENRAGELYVVNGNKQLNRFSGGGFTAAQLTLPKGINYWGWGWYQTTFQDRQGEWWMATGRGLVRYPRVTRIEQLTHARPKAIYTTRDGLPADEIFRLFEDSRGDIWISTLGNAAATLTRWERASETFHRYTPTEGIPVSAPAAFCEDAAGNLWIGYYLGGLLRYSQGRFTPFNQADGVPPGFVEGLYLDRAGRLWVPTAEGGVARVDDPGAEHPRFVTYSAANGLSSNQANCVVEDDWGMIYIGTGRGVDKLNPATGHIRHYTTADGLASSFVDVAYRQRDGTLWFGTLQGLSRLLPRPEMPATPPPIVISGLRIAGEDYPLSDLGSTGVAVPELGASRNNIQIEFAGLSLAVGESLRYEYQLAGASSEWSAPTSQRAVSYPNLAPGSYQFLVRAVSADGTLSPTPASVSFKILPPVWLRWWFVMLVTGVIAAACVAIARYRYQRMKAVREAEAAVRRSREERLLELERVRKRIATDLHDDIGSSLTQISLLSEVVRHKVAGVETSVSEPLSEIAGMSRELVDAMSDIVWAINPQKDHLSDLLQRMRHFATQAFIARQIEFKFLVPNSERDVTVGANVRRELFLIFKEGINNIIRHSGCTQAEIEFRADADSLFLQLRDNGQGFDTSQKRDGHGLLSMRDRTRELGGVWALTSEAGRGATLTLTIPLTQIEPESAQKAPQNNAPPT